MKVPLDDNAAFLFAIIGLGIVIPILLGTYALLKVSAAKSRLERMRKDDAQ
ncbi:MAG: hypothetical protein AAGH90_02920 [Pseudomonadota bacterium]